MTDAPNPQLTDYPAAVGVALGVLFTAILLVVSGRFDPTSGVLTLSILVVLAFIGIVMVSLLFRDPRRRDECGGGGRADGGVWSGRGLLARPREREFVMCGFGIGTIFQVAIFVIVVLVVLALLRALLGDFFASITSAPYWNIIQIVIGGVVAILILLFLWRLAECAGFLAGSARLTSHKRHWGR